MIDAQKVVDALRAGIDKAHEYGTGTVICSVEFVEKYVMPFLRQEGWIKVEDALPTEKGQECWVWSDDWSEDAEPEEDFWEGDRGEQHEWGNGPIEDRKFIASGWYSCTGMRITHWMPIAKPIPPEKPKKED